MQITFSPVRAIGATPPMSVNRNVLTIDGEAFDFAGLAEGDQLPAEAVASDFVIGMVERKSGEIHLTIRLHHGARAPEATRFPAPVTITDGPVPLPPYDGEA